jgi:uncharacterized membrane protein YphA (DoxX/SURF4 family)
VGVRHQNDGSMSASRLFWLKALLALALLSEFLLSFRLWEGSRHYPLTPVWAGLPDIPPLVSRAWFVGLLVLLMVIAVARRPRWYIVSFVILAGLLSLWDQSRWQPWFYQQTFMLAALAVYPWAAEDANKRETAVNILRLIIASTYFWSGLQKLNAGFFDDVFPYLVEPVVALFPGFPEELLRPAAIAVPFIETGIGVWLLTRFRNAAVVLALCMHAFILFAIGPLGQDVNTVVWPWNIAMMGSVVLLFWRTRGFRVKDVVIPSTSPLHAVVLLLFGVMPLFSFFGLWDSYLSASLYSGNTKDGILYVSEDVRRELSGEVPDRALRSGGHTLDIFAWSMEELNVPPYPETRIYKSVASHVCAQAHRPSEVSLVVVNKPPLLDGGREAEIYDCSGLETGAHRTLRIG